MQNLSLTSWRRNILDNYIVKISPRAIRDLDNIYYYLAHDKLAPESAKRQTERLKSAILGLSLFPQSHQMRLEGRYANKGYRQLIVDNYIVVFRINEAEKTVIVVTVQHMRQNF